MAALTLTRQYVKLCDVADFGDRQLCGAVGEIEGRPAPRVLAERKQWERGMLALVILLRNPAGPSAARPHGPTSGAEPVGPPRAIWTLGAYMAGLFTRLVRSGLLEVLGEDYVRTARAKGLPDRVVLYGHALRNMAIPLVTVIGLQFGTLLGGAVVVETVFSWPGVGTAAVTAIGARDYALVQAVVLVVSLFFVAVNLMIDLLYAYIDPRIHYA